MASDDKFRSHRLSEQFLFELLDKLDASDDASKRNRRKSDRLPYRKRDLRLQITHPGGGIIDCEVPSRNLSSTGMSVVYWNYLHAGTRCTVHLKRHLGGVDPVEASVMWCRHVGGPHHEVGLRFTNRIFPKLFVEPNLIENVETEEIIDPLSIEGSILHVDSQLVERQLLKFMVGKTNATVVSVAEPSDALAMVQKQAFDLVASELDLGDSTIEKFIVQLRQKGYSGPIICITAETAPARLAKVTEAGAASVLQKPYTANKLTRLLHTHLARAYVPPSERIYSEFSTAPEMDELIDAYVKDVKTMLAQLKSEISADHFDQVRRMLSAIKGSAGGYGFSALSNAAQDAVKSLDATISIAQSAFQIQQVEELIRRLTAGRPTAA